ncbi:unknown [Candidatus Colimorpha enterica]|uniref:Uncharacterized protein n=1 Tax=Candidatus Colimorpha enterica TaxID=3083063 RepID=R6UYJ0_9BACT|nr:unknown [Candidatus Colimorpha enterica]
MKNFSDQFRKTVNDMKPYKSEIRHSVLNSGTNRKTVHVHQGFGQKFGTLLTASLSFLLVLGIIVGGGLLRGMKKPLSLGGIDSVSDSVSGIIEIPDPTPDTETVIPTSGTEYPDITYETVTETIEIYPTDTTETVDPSDTQPDVPTDPEIPVDSQPVDPPDNDPDIVFSYDPIDDFGTDVLDEVKVIDSFTVAINDREVSSSMSIFFDALYTVGGVEKTGTMFVVLGSGVPLGEGYIPDIYLIMYDPETETVVAAKKWLMAGGIFVNSDIPGTFLVAGVSYDQSDAVYGYFGVYRVTDSLTGKPEFVLDSSYDSCKIHQTYFNSLANNGITKEEMNVINRDKKYNDNYYQRFSKLIRGSDYAEILDVYGGVNFFAGECVSIPRDRWTPSDKELAAFSYISYAAGFFDKK